MTVRRVALAVVMVALACRAAPPATTAHEFALEGHGVLVLAIPEGWSAHLQGSPERGPPTVSLTPRSGAKFEVLVTAIWPAGAAALPDEALLRAEVAAAAKSAEGQSVERSLAVKPLGGSGAQGFYFVATDRAPAPGEYKYLTQGMARTGQVVLAFTILTNDGQAEVASAALELIRGAIQRLGAAT